MRSLQEVQDIGQLRPLRNEEDFTVHYNNGNYNGWRLRRLGEFEGSEEFPEWSDLEGYDRIYLSYSRTLLKFFTKETPGFKNLDEEFHPEPKTTLRRLFLWSNLMEIVKLLKLPNTWDEGVLEKDQNMES